MKSTHEASSPSSTPHLAAVAAPVLKRHHGRFTKQLLAAAMGPALALLALDSAISHFAAKEMTHPGQAVPVVFGAIAVLALLPLGIRKLGLTLRTARLTMQVTGMLAAVVGIAGTVFHLIPLAKDIIAEPFTWEGLQESLSVAPPLGAPGGFAGVGIVLIALGSPKVLVKLRLRSK